MRDLNNKKLVIDNQLVKGRYQLTREEQNFIYLAISQVKPEDTKFTEYMVHITELESAELTRKNYQRYREFARRLRSREIIIEDDKRILVAGWFADIEYIKDTGYIKATISEKLKPYLLELKQEFTQAKLPTLLQFNSKYSSRLYLLLKSDFDRQKKYKSNLYVNYEVEDLNKRFELPKSYFIRYSAFKEKFLEKAIDEISTKTDLQVSFKELKTGRKITTIQFCISAVEKPIENLNLGFEEMLSKEDLLPEHINSKAREVLLSDELNLSTDQIKKYMRNYRLEDIETVCIELWNMWDSAKIISRRAIFFANIKKLNEKKNQNHKLFGFDEV